MITITFPQYIDKIKLSNSRKAKYYEKNVTKKEIPKKYRDPEIYNWVNYPYKSSTGKKDRWLWTNIETKEKVLLNPKAVGTPKYIPINTQYFYEGFRDEHSRMKIMHDIKEYYMKHIPRIKPIKENKFPIKIEFVFYTIIETNFDLDNHSWIYIKAFNDLIKALNIIPDDNVNFINEYSAKIVKIPNFTDRKIVVNITQNG